MPAKNLTISAVWEANYYRVCYYNEYMLPIFMQDYQCGEKISELTPPKLDGYEFKGWKDAPETMPAKDLYLTPIWVPADDESNSDSTDDSSNKTPLYLGIGAGTLALAGVAALLFFRLHP